MTEEELRYKVERLWITPRMDEPTDEQRNAYRQELAKLDRWQTDENWKKRAGLSWEPFVREIEWRRELLQWRLGECSE